MPFNSRQRGRVCIFAFVTAFVSTLTIFSASSSVAQEVLSAGCPAVAEWDSSLADTVTTVDILLVDEQEGVIATLASNTPHDGSEAIDVPCLSGPLNAFILIMARVEIPFAIQKYPVIVTSSGPTIDATSGGGSVDDSCEATVEFAATILDDCGVDPADVTVMVMQVGSNATVGEPTIEINPAESGVKVTGSVLVSVLTGPATLTIKFSAADNCSTITTTIDTVMIVDDTAPVVVCPADTTVECSASGGTPASDLAVFFDAFTADDNCDSNPTISNDAPELFPLGATVVMFMAMDASGNSSECTATVNVVDTTPPDISMGLNRYFLWPPNHKFHEIVAEVTVSDVCDSNATFTLTAIESNESPNGRGDGNTQPDIRGADYGEGDTSFELRAERSGGGDGRVYTVIYTATDESGNSASDTATIVVPHDMRGNARPSNGFNNVGSGFDPNTNQVVLIIPARGEDPNKIHDPADIDVFRAQIGNLKGIVSPEKVYRGDVDGDQLDDIVIAYPKSAIDVLFLKSKGQRDKTSLHYADFEGNHWVVENIFDMGHPMTVDLGQLTEMVVTEEESAEESGDGGSDPDGGEVITQNPTAKHSGLWVASHPNPFNPQTTITFGLPIAGVVNVRVYDARGQLVRTLYEGTKSAGDHSVKWAGRNDRGMEVGSGIYFLRLETANQNVTRKIVLLK